MSEMFGATVELSPEERFAWSGDFMVDDIDEVEKLKYIALRWRADPIMYVVEKYRFTPLPYQVLDLLILADSPIEVWEFYTPVIGEDAYYEYQKRQLLMPSGHGLGKTRFLAAAGTWHRDTHPFSKTIITAPTMSQITGQLFGEFNKLRRLAKATKLGSLFEQDWTVLSSQIVHSNPDNSDWGIFAATARADSPESLQGSHAIDDDDEFGVIAEIFSEETEKGASGGMMVLAEEASAIPDVVRTVLEGALSEDGARFAAAGNPTRPDGWFADDMDKPQRYAVTPLDCRMSNSEKIYKIPYRDFGGNIHSLPIKGRVSPTYWNNFLAECDGDEEHDRFRVRVRGVKPRSAFEQAIQTKWIQDAMARTPTAGDTTRPLVVSLDVGLTSDKHAISVRHDFNFLLIEEWLPPKKQVLITKEAVRRVKDSVNQFSQLSKKTIIIVDSNGVGHGSAEDLYEFYEDNPKVTVLFFNSGLKALDSRRYYRHRDQMWHQSGPGFFADPRATIVTVPGLLSQLTATQCHEDVSRKIKAETKDAIFKRSGKKSGNAADSILQNIYAEKLVFQQPESKPKEDENIIQLPTHPKAVTDHLKRLQRRGERSYFIGH